MKWRVVILTMLLSVGWVATAEPGPEQAWQNTLRKEVPLLGHRNWIVIADAAYPWQTAAGVETVVTDADQEAVLDVVLKMVEAAKHVKPLIYLDKELAYVAETDAPGISAYRAQLKKRLGDRPVKTELHEEIIKKVDAAGQTFHVLLLKTRMTLPYTSVFLQLDCGYWSGEAEQRLRDALSAADAKTAR